MSNWSGTEGRDWYLGLPDSDKLTFLVLVTGHLTIHGRASGLDLSGEAQTKAIKGLNELLHLISFHFEGIGRKQERYTDDLFLQALFEKASLHGLSTQLTESLDYARTRPHWEQAD